MVKKPQIRSKRRRVIDLLRLNPSALYSSSKPFIITAE